MPPSTPEDRLPPRLAGKVALVTGGNSGIGAQVSFDLARAGASVVVAARRRLEGERIVARIRAAGGEALFAETDVTQAASMQSAVERCIERYGRLDCAFNSAGTTGTLDKDAVDYEETVFDQTLAVNLKGTWLAMKYQIAAMLRTGGGSVVNCASAAGLRGGARACAYYASKHAVVGLTKSVALEYAARNVRVNVVCPGLVKTELVAREFAAVPEKLAMLSQKIPMARPGAVEEIAAAVLWLCSAESSYITGATLSVDGGFVI